MFFGPTSSSGVVLTESMLWLSVIPASDAKLLVTATAVMPLWCWWLSAPDASWSWGPSLKVWGSGPQETRASRLVVAVLKRLGDGEERPRLPLTLLLAWWIISNDSVAGLCSPWALAPLCSLLLSRCLLLYCRQKRRQLHDSCCLVQSNRPVWPGANSGRQRLSACGPQG